MNCLFFFSQMAWADYPSPLPNGATSYYQSLGTYYWSRYRGVGESSSLPNNASVLGITSYSSFGLGISESMDIHVALPLRYASYTSAAPIFGVGKIEIAAKYLLLQEGEGPLTISIRPGIRVGTLHAGSRGEMHNIGEGSLDFGAGVSLGRLGFWDMGFYWLDLGARYWYRIASSFDLSDPPHPEISYDINMGLSPNSLVGIGFTALGLHRLDGENLPVSDGGNAQDKWASLRAVQIKAGVKGFLYLSDKITVDSTLLTSVFAENNPDNEIYFGIGVNYFQPSQR